MEGNYVRIRIGAFEQRNMYRFVKILHTCQLDDAYDFVSEHTTLGIMCAFGKDRKAFSLDAISSRSLTQSEFQQWLDHLQTQHFALGNSNNNNSRQKSSKTKQNKIPTHASSKAFRVKNTKLLKSYAPSMEDFESMISRKRQAGLVKCKLGVDLVRLERHVTALEDSGEFDKALSAKSELEALVAEKARRQVSDRHDNVTRLNTINRRNRKFNQARDLEAGKLNAHQRAQMSAAEKLQYQRNTAEKTYMSRNIIDRMIDEGKLVVQEDGTITTVNKITTVEPLPEDLNARLRSTSPDKKWQRKIKVKTYDEKNNAANMNSSNNAEDCVKYYDQDGQEVVPKSVEERQEYVMKITNEDGSVTTYNRRRTDESDAKTSVVVASKSTNVTTTDVPRKRTGLSLADYYARATS